MVALIGVADLDSLRLILTEDTLQRARLSDMASKGSMDGIGRRLHRLMNVI